MDAKVYLMGLVIDCPLNDVTEDCPMAKYRNHPVTKLIEVINRIPNLDAVRVIKYHQNCLKSRNYHLKVS